MQEWRARFEWNALGGGFPGIDGGPRDVSIGAFEEHSVAVTMDLGPSCVSFERVQLREVRPHEEKVRVVAKWRLEVSVVRCVVFEALAHHVTRKERDVAAVHRYTYR